MSSPTTPTAATHRRRVGSGAILADTEAWRDSVMTAQSEEKNWRESVFTSTTASVEQHPYAPAPKARSQDSNHSSIRTSSIPRLKKVGSNASVGALLPASPTPPISAISTMNSDSMSSAAHYPMNGSRFRPESRGGITTDNDSDADFQSAYSTSPRMTAGGASDLEKAGSGYGSGGYNSGSKRRSRQGIPAAEPRSQLKTLARTPSFTGTTISTGAVGGLGLVGADLNSRSRASSIGTNLEGASATGKSTSGSDHTVGFPETHSTATLSQEHGKPNHPPVVSLGNRGSYAGLRTRQDGA